MAKLARVDRIVGQEPLADAGRPGARTPIPTGSDSRSPGCTTPRRSLTEGLHTDGPMGTAMLTIMAAFAQLEYDTVIERTRAGLAAAAANGRKGGRPRKVDDADAAKARQLREKGIAATDIAKMLAVSRATVYRYLSDGASLVA
jgi:hypothetical protein